MLQRDGQVDILSVGSECQRGDASEEIMDRASAQGGRAVRIAIDNVSPQTVKLIIFITRALSRPGSWKIADRFAWGADSGQAVPPRLDSEEQQPGNEQGSGKRKDGVVWRVRCLETGNHFFFYDAIIL